MLVDKEEGGEEVEVGEEEEVQLLLLIAAFQCKYNYVPLVVENQTENHQIETNLNFILSWVYIILILK